MNCQTNTVFRRIISQIAHYLNKDYVQSGYLKVCNVRYKGTEARFSRFMCTLIITTYIFQKFSSYCILTNDG